MMKLKHKFYYDEVYGKGYVFLLNVKNDKQVESILKSKYPKSWKVWQQAKKNGDVSIENCSARNIQTEGRQFIVVRHQPSFGIPFFIGAVTHECLHATMAVFRNVGVKYDEQSHNEHFTYYLESLVRIALAK